MLEKRTFAGRSVSELIYQIIINPDFIDKDLGLRGAELLAYRLEMPVQSLMKYARSNSQLPLKFLNRLVNVVPEFKEELIRGQAIDMQSIRIDLTGLSIEQKAKLIRFTIDRTQTLKD